MSTKARAYNQYGQIIADGGSLASALRMSAGESESDTLSFLATRYPEADHSTLGRVIEAALLGLAGGEALAAQAEVAIETTAPVYIATRPTSIADIVAGLAEGYSVADIARELISANPDELAIDLSGVPVIPDIFGLEAGPQRGLISAQVHLPAIDKTYRVDVEFAGNETLSDILTSIVETTIEIVKSPQRFGNAEEVAASGAVQISIVYAARAY